ncbi:hypothetical protein OUZ56_020713 [Daphnia magna]|uniref:Uncharacterized protein n=1 Tax=Daphnia magna TaxID=35525 RepID=A0ABQ9ZF84_9CRUS|nr:hypothetical protein OUZ56_020713 [Daphnia magna]
MVLVSPDFVSHCGDVYCSCCLVLFECELFDIEVVLLCIVLSCGHGTNGGQLHDLVGIWTEHDVGLSSWQFCIQWWSCFICFYRYGYLWSLLCLGVTVLMI